jgi:deoxyribonuclease-4
VASDPLAGRFVGPHLQLTKGLLRAAVRAVSIGATCVQVFADNPTAWRRKPQPPAKIADFREQLRAGGVGRLAVHASYLVNLAAANEEFREKSIENLTSDLLMGAAYGAHAVNVHIGSHVGQGVEVGTRLVGEGITEVLRRVPAGVDSPLLVLENSAGGGGTLGTTIPEIAAILRAAEVAGAPRERVGVCLDTAHLWGSGYDLSEPAPIDAFVDEVGREIGLERLAMLHLNDSKAKRGSRHDRHEHIGAGVIGERGLRHLLLHPALVSIPTYLETPGMDQGYDAVNLERVRRLISGEPLEELPPEAFAPRAGRMRRRPAKATPAKDEGAAEAADGSTASSTID